MDKKIYTKAVVNPVFGILCDVAEELGYRAYVVGGFVRDFFLNKDNDDIDIVVEGSGLKMATAFAERIGSDVDLYENFGTAKVHISKDSPLYSKVKTTEVEFVGCRKEMYERGSRKPIVEEGTIHDDISRRDFTINAMAISINKDTFGELVDFYNGLEDLKNRVIKCVGNADERFSEDPLRIWRLVRFKCKLSLPGSEFHFDIPTFEAAERNAYRNEILSKERIVEELNKILYTEYAPEGIRLLSKIGLLKLVLPEVEALKLPEHKGHKDIFEHTLQVLWNVSRESNDLWLRWAALLHDIGKVPTAKYIEGTGWTFYDHASVGAKMVETIFLRLKLPTDGRMAFVRKMVDMHMRPTTLAEEGVTDSAIRRLLFDAGDDIDSLMILAKCDVTTRYESKRQKIYDNIVKIEEHMREVEEKDSIRNFKNPIDGFWIMETFGLKPGKEISIIKDAVKNAILDGIIGNDFEEAKHFAIERAKELGLEAKL